jgi:hypothetical protein
MLRENNVHTVVRRGSVMRSWAVIVILTIVASIVAWRLLRHTVAASLLSAFVVTSAFQLFAWFQLGHVDKLWPIAAAVSFVVSFGVALIAIVLYAHFAQPTR